MRKIKEEALKAASKWWSEVVTNPEFDNGDTSLTGGMTMIMANQLKEGVTQEQKEKFEEALFEVLKEKIKEDWDYFSFRSDYGPDGNLYKAFKRSGISEHNSPWKTDMILKKEKVLVSYGYAAPFETIWEETPCQT